MAWLVQACSSAHPLVPGLAWAPLELCLLQSSPGIEHTVTNITNGSFLYQFISILSSAWFAVFPGYSKLCVFWLPEAFWSLKTLLTCSRCEVLCATLREKYASWKKQPFLLQLQALLILEITQCQKRGPGTNFIVYTVKLFARSLEWFLPGQSSQASSKQFLGMFWELARARHHAQHVVWMRAPFFGWS